MEENPFPDLKIASYKFLEELEGRQSCPKCGRSRKYYCYTCFVPLAALEERLPKVKLPIKVDIIKHPNETDGKSTSVHAAILASDDVTIYNYPVIPDYDAEKVLLLCPAEDSLTLPAYAARLSEKLSWKRSPGGDSSHDETPPQCVDATSLSHTPETAENTAGMVAELSPAPSGGGGASPKTGSTPYIQSSEAESPGRSAPDVVGGLKRKLEELNDAETENDLASTDSESKRLTLSASGMKFDCPVERVVFIDSTWRQVYQIRTDERLTGLQKIELTSQETKFWRHQNDKPSTYLATIEAVYYFLREYHDLFVPAAYSGQYDNLLFFFCFTYGRIRQLYGGGQHLKAYKGPRNGAAT